jgi:SAM-dependent methyltransferase
MNADPFGEPLHRGRLLHFGCGPNKIGRPWENYDQEVDIRRPLPFPDLSASYIFAEHVIEHVHFHEGLHFLRQCRRVLEPGGVLRFSFPDVTRFCSANIDLYLEFICSLGRAGATPADAYRFVLEGSGHLSCWTEAIGIVSTLAAGFAAVEPAQGYGRSKHGLLDGIDGHHLSATLAAATIETTVLEAKK